MHAKNNLTYIPPRYRKGTIWVYFLFAGGYVMRKLLFLFTILLALFNNYAFAEGVSSDDDDETRILSNYGYIVGTWQKPLPSICATIIDNSRRSS